MARVRVSSADWPDGLFSAFRSTACIARALCEVFLIIVFPQFINAELQ